MLVRQRLFEAHFVFQAELYSADKKAKGSLRHIITPESTIREIPPF